MREHMFLCSSPDLAYLSQDKHRYVPNYGFLNKNDSLAYFAILGELSVDKRAARI